MPEKASELRAVMTRYLDAIDAEDVQDVYKARFAGLDHFEAMARQHHTKSIARAKGDQMIAEAMRASRSNSNASNATARNAAPICRAKRFDPES